MRPIMTTEFKYPDVLMLFVIDEIGCDGKPLTVGRYARIEVKTVRRFDLLMTRLSPLIWYVKPLHFIPTGGPHRVNERTFGGDVERGRAVRKDSNAIDDCLRLTNNLLCLGIERHDFERPVVHVQQMTGARILRGEALFEHGLSAACVEVQDFKLRGRQRGARKD